MKDLKISLVSLANAADNHGLMVKYMNLRSEIFIDKIKWELRNTENIEFEQYDRPNTYYVIAHIGDEVVGGARLTRTDWVFGTGRVRYSFMVRDAALGLLPGMPEDLCHSEPPLDKDVWELTRLVVMDDKPIAKYILHAANYFLFNSDAKECIFLGSPIFMRMSKIYGYKPKPLGKIVGNKDGRFIAFSCDVRPLNTDEDKEFLPMLTGNNWQHQTINYHLSAADNCKNTFMET